MKIRVCYTYDPDENSIDSKQIYCIHVCVYVYIRTYGRHGTSLSIALKLSFFTHTAFGIQPDHR